MNPEQTFMKEPVIKPKRIQIPSWDKNFEKMINVITLTGKLPLNTDPELGNFMHKQKDTYKKELSTGIIVNKNKHDMWKQTIERYPHLFLKDSAWETDFNTICTKINTNPEKYEGYNSVSSWINNKDNDVNKKRELYSTGRWIQAQNDNYEIIKKILIKNNYNDIDKIPKETEPDNIMKNKTLYDKWTEFKTGVIYKKYFMNKVDDWFDNARKLKIYLDEHKNLPTNPVTIKKEKNNELTSLSTWVASQKRRKREGTVENIMLYDEWAKFKRDNGC